MKCNTKICTFTLIFFHSTAVLPCAVSK